MSKTLNEQTGMEIAIIGMACKFPGANNINEYWNNIKNGVESISFYTVDELRKRGIPESFLNNPHYVKAGGACKDIDKFDAQFFGYFPREVEIMDPQHRLFLECCWQAWEDAGYTSEQYNGVVGVFGGITMNTYLVSNVLQHPDIIENVGHLQNMIGNDKDFVTTRVSYKLNLKGPSYAIQTACSTSLVAIHVACSNLLNGECNIAIAGGSSIRLPEEAGYMFQTGGTSSPDGHCRPFDAKAEGSVVGNGAGIIVLKKLTDALKDGDHIYAVIKGSAVGNDGGDKAAFSTPSSSGQSRIMSEALAIANVDPNTISCVEAHGTGTIIGDPIEFAALANSFTTKSSSPKVQYCALGSVKANIGHLDAAAGVSGVIKMALALYNKEIPPLVNFESPNNQINLTQSPFYVNRALKKWEALNKNTPRRAGINSIGLGGANAFAILEEAPKSITIPADSDLNIIPISAKTPEALIKAIDNLKMHIVNNDQINIDDVAYTLQVGRAKFNNKVVYICKSKKDLIEQLQNKTLPKSNLSSISETLNTVCFMFPGQGSQYFKMANELYQKESFFKSVVDECLKLIKPYLEYNLQELLISPLSTSEEFSIDDTIVTQPALFIVEYALSKLLISWGIQPKTMIGHSIGEYVAACLAGVFSLKDALMLVAERGKLLQQTPVGKMLCAFISEHQAMQYVKEGVEIAAINSKNQSIFAGNNKSIDLLSQRLKEDNISFALLNTSRAFHSRIIENTVVPFVKIVSKIKLNKPQIKFISNFTGEYITDEMATDPKYWGQHLRNTVQFSKGIEVLKKDPSIVFIEVGPGTALTNLVNTHLQNSLKLKSFYTLGSAKENHQEHLNLITLMGNLWLLNEPINWQNFHQNQRNRVSLPTYPFERKRYWLEAKEFSINGLKYTNSDIKADPVKLNYNVAHDNIPSHSTNLSGLVNSIGELLKNIEVTIKFNNGNFVVSQNSRTSCDTTNVQTNPSVTKKEAVSPTVQKPANTTLLLGNIWKNLLGINRDIKDNDNIFDLGVHSLLLTQMLSRVQQIFSISLTMQELMDNPNFSSMLKLVESKSDNGIKTDKSYVLSSRPSKNNVESKLESIWKELLGVTNVDDKNVSIFDLGAHSLLLTQMLNLINKQLNIVITIKDLFDNPTFEKMLTLLLNKQNNITETTMLAPVTTQKDKIHDGEQVDNILEEMKGLSPEAIQELLKEVE